MMRLGYFFILGSGLVGLLSILLSWLWHRLDQRLPDPNERQDPWSPQQWAEYQNRARLMRIIAGLGIFTMYLSLVGALAGFIIIGYLGAQS